MDDISFEEGIPLSINPIPNNLKATFFNLAPLASANFSNTPPITHHETIII